MRRILRSEELGSRTDIQGIDHLPDSTLRDGEDATSSECSARCACDVPSHNYTYSFEPKHDWTSVYASSAEIRTYFEDFALKYGLQRFFKLSHMVEKTQWSEENGKWDIEVNDLATGKAVRDSCHILIHACGYLNKPAWPKVPGLDDYQGIKLHSANYDNSISLEGKEVILVGNGSALVSCHRQHA